MIYENVGFPAQLGSKAKSKSWLPLICDIVVVLKKQTLKDAVSN